MGTLTICRAAWSQLKRSFQNFILNDNFFQHILHIFYEIALLVEANYLTSTLVQVISWCCQAKAVTRANVNLDPCAHMLPLGHNELILHINTFKPEQKDSLIVHGIFKCILSGNTSFLQLKIHWCLFKGVNWHNNNKSVMVLIMAWHQPGHKPLPVPMLTQFFYIIWLNVFINSLRPSDAIWQHRSGSILAQVMACCLTAPSHYQNQCWLISSKV